MSIDQLEFILAGAETLRWHTTPTVKEQSVGLHSFHVAWLCHHLMQGNVRPHLLLAALSHDLGEHITGDMPAPLKRGLSEQCRKEVEDIEMNALTSVGLNYEQYLTDNEKRVLKLADVCEYGLYVIRERRLGNRTMGPIMVRILQYLDSMVLMNPVEDDLVEYIMSQWENANDFRR